MFKYTIGIRTPDLEACSAASEPSAPLLAPKYRREEDNLICSKLKQISHKLFWEIQGVH
jgi:hypothetical protein